MPAYVLISISNSSAFSQALEEKYSGQYRAIDDRSWVVIANETSKDVWDKVAGSQGLGFIAPISLYFGRLSADFWEWLKLNMEKVSG